METALKSNRQAQRAVGAESSAGANSLAVPPPDYGIDFIRRNEGSRTVEGGSRSAKFSADDPTNQRQAALAPSVRVRGGDGFAHRHRHT